MKYIKTYESNRDDIEYFIDYLLDFYSSSQTKLTRKVIKKYVYDFVSKRRRLGVWGGGDSFDREIFKELLSFKFGLKKIKDLEYDIRPYLTELEIEADKYNL